MGTHLPVEHSRHLFSGHNLKRVFQYEGMNNGNKIPAPECDHFRELPSIIFSGFLHHTDRRVPYL